MKRLLQILPDSRKKSASNLAFMNRSYDLARVTSSTIVMKDTFVSTPSFGVLIKWA